MSLKTDNCQKSKKNSSTIYSYTEYCCNQQLYCYKKSSIEARKTLV